jgi:hypothetical protein
MANLSVKSVETRIFGMSFRKDNNFETKKDKELKKLIINARKKKQILSEKEMELCGFKVM